MFFCKVCKRAENFLLVFLKTPKQTAPLLPNCHFIMSFSTLSNPQALFADLWRSAISFLTWVWGRGVDSTQFVRWQWSASSYMFNFWHSWETLQNILSVHTVNSMSSKHPGHNLLKDSQLFRICPKKPSYSYILNIYNKYIFLNNLHLYTQTCISDCSDD